MVMGGPPVSRRVPMVSALSPQCQEDLTVTGGLHGDGRTPGVQEGPMATGGPHGDRRVPMVSPWRQEDLMVTGGPPLSRRVPRCQRRPHGAMRTPGARRTSW